MSTSKTAGSSIIRKSGLLICIGSIAIAYYVLKFGIPMHDRILLQQPLLHPRDKTGKFIEVSSSQKSISELGSKSSKNIIYVKTHKTASTTVQNILERFTEYNKVPPFPKPYLGGYPAYFNQKFLDISKAPDDGEMTLSIMGHMRFHIQAIEKFAPNDSKYVTILRNPIRQFESAFYYYYGKFHKGIPRTRLEKLSCFGEPYLHLLQQTNSNISTYIKAAQKSLSTEAPWFFRSKNSQSFDLGMNPQLEDETEIRNYVKKLERKFDLVMVADYFLESLILLKDTLSMDWSDLQFGVDEKGRYKPLNFSSSEDGIIRRLNKQALFVNYISCFEDFILYEHFNTTFWKKVEKYGRTRMQKDIQKLLSIQRTEQSLQHPKEKKVSRMTRSIVWSSNANAWRRKSLNYAHRVGQIKSKIKQGCPHKKICQKDSLIQELAEAMNANYGWCPH